MDARNIPVSRTDLQGWVDEALANNEDPEQLVRDYLKDYEGLPATVNIAGEEVALVEYLISDLASYMPQPDLQALENEQSE
jgi:hypothetical protein